MRVARNLESHQASSCRCLRRSAKNPTPRTGGIRRQLSQSCDDRSRAFARLLQRSRRPRAGRPSPWRMEVNGQVDIASRMLAAPDPQQTMTPREGRAGLRRALRSSSPTARKERRHRGRASAGRRLHEVSHTGQRVTTAAPATTRPAKRDRHHRLPSGQVGIPA